MSRRADDPRDWCETDAELAREVLDPEELADYQRRVRDLMAVRALAKKHRDERMGVQPTTWRDPWAESGEEWFDGDGAA